MENPEPVRISNRTTPETPESSQPSYSTATDSAIPEGAYSHLWWVEGEIKSIDNETKILLIETADGDRLSIDFNEAVSQGRAPQKLSQGDEAKIGYFLYDYTAYGFGNTIAFNVLPN